MQVSAYVQKKAAYGPDMLFCRGWNDIAVYDAGMGLLDCRWAYYYGILVCFREVMV